VNRLERKNMGLSIEIQKKPNKTDTRKINKPTDVIELNEIKEIQNAIQEHLLLIGLDGANNIRTINLIGVGKSNLVKVDSKYIVRTALVTASEKVILVHNHPSNSLEPSKQDKYVTDVVSKLLKVFNIEMLDHIIVTEDNYISMMYLKRLENNYVDERINFLDKVLLSEENNRLKKENERLNAQIQKYKKIENELEEELE
jgi:DNA repair protein RadC